MERDRNYLINAYNATSTDDPPGSDELETYETWLERQLLSRIERIEELEGNTQQKEQPRMTALEIIDNHLERPSRGVATFYVEEIVEMMEEFANQSQPISDEDIEAHFPKKPIPEELSFKDRLNILIENEANEHRIEGARAYRDGQIKKITK